MENKNKLILSGLVLLSLFLLYWSFSASIKGSKTEVNGDSVQVSTPLSTLSDKPISNIPEHSEESFEKAIESEIEEDPCATPEGYTDEGWREHMGHHPDQYTECL
ncbi:MAG: hypothetical protein V3R82_03930 [Candidatus Hydrothermarchaeales archaeon]